MHAFSFKRYKEVIIKQDWDGLANIILESIYKLKLAGADFVIIPSNTPHYGFKRINDESPLPVLNLISLTADECQRLGFKKVAVLGTTLTMKNGLYADPLKTRGIDSVIPDNELCDSINSLIMDKIIPSKINPLNVRKIADAINNIACDAVILGCTELPEVYNQGNINKPIIDTTRLLACKALEFACKSLL